MYLLSFTSRYFIKEETVKANHMVFVHYEFCTQVFFCFCMFTVFVDQMLLNVL
jgi:hypothetical protein